MLHLDIVWSERSLDVRKRILETALRRRPIQRESTDAKAREAEGEGGGVGGGNQKAKIPWSYGVYGSGETCEKEFEKRKAQILLQNAAL